MAELMTVARPYAEAVFGLACDERSTNEWSDVLDCLAVMAQDPNMEAVITQPRYTPQEITALLWSILEKSTSASSQEMENFIEVLAQNHRLILLPQIAEQFKQLKAEADGTVEAMVESAFALTEAQQSELTDMLSKRYGGKKVRLNVRDNPDLIGGVRVQVGDEIIDSSIRSKLHAMAANLKN